METHLTSQCNKVIVCVCVCVCVCIHTYSHYIYTHTENNFICVLLLIYIYKVIVYIYAIYIHTHIYETTLLRYSSHTMKFIFCFVLCFRAVLAAYGGFQARGRIGATATSLCHSHSNVESELVCDLHHSSRQHQISNPLSEARNRTRIFMDTRQIRFHFAMMGTPLF